MKVKFKGKIYEDVRRDSKDGHVWFGGNEFEHVPEKRTPYYQPAFTYIHSFKQTGPGAWKRVSKKSTAKVEIIEEG